MNDTNDGFIVIFEKRTHTHTRNTHLVKNKIYLISGLWVIIINDVIKMKIFWFFCEESIRFILIKKGGGENFFSFRFFFVFVCDGEAGGGM